MEAAQECREDPALIAYAQPGTQLTEILIAAWPSHEDPLPHHRRKSRD